MFTEHVLAQQAVSAFLLSWWKALLILLPMGAWAWLVSSKLDKDARYLHLNHKMWNGVHMGAGVVAIIGIYLVSLD